MHRSTIIISLFLVLVITVMIVVWQNYNLSQEYNFVTAKFDIKDGNCRLITVGGDMDSSKEARAIAARYGFKNVYLPKATAKELKGIKRYNETIEVYLSFRNGSNWRDSYREEMDSLARATSAPLNPEK